MCDVQRANGEAGTESRTASACFKAVECGTVALWVLFTAAQSTDGERNSSGRGAGLDCALAIDPLPPGALVTGAGAVNQPLGDEIGVWALDQGYNPSWLLPRPGGFGRPPPRGSRNR
jgi:hypothetical protein